MQIEVCVLGQPAVGLLLGHDGARLKMISLGEDCPHGRAIGNPTTSTVPFQHNDFLHYVSGRLLYCLYFD